MLPVKWRRDTYVVKKCYMPKAAQSQQVTATTGLDASFSVLQTYSGIPVS